ncbi:hypothetical protein O162_35060, partial [Pseudomonas putida SJ3]
MAIAGLFGTANGLALVVQQDAVAAGEGGQRAHHLQGLQLGLEALAAVFQHLAHGPWQALGQAVQALAQQFQVAPRVLRGQ